MAKLYRFEFKFYFTLKMTSENVDVGKQIAAKNKRSLTRPVTSRSDEK